MTPTFRPAPAKSPAPINVAGTEEVQNALSERLTAPPGGLWWVAERLTAPIFAVSDTLGTVELETPKTRTALIPFSACSGFRQIYPQELGCASAAGSC
jgi:hypothetical protein